MSGGGDFKHPDIVKSRFLRVKVWIRPGGVQALRIDRQQPAVPPQNGGLRTTAQNQLASVQTESCRFETQRCLRSYGIAYPEVYDYDEPTVRLVLTTREVR